MGTHSSMYVLGICHLHALPVLSLLRQVHGREPQAVPGRDGGGGVLQEESHVGRVTVLGRDVQRGPAVAALAANRVGLSK